MAKEEPKNWTCPFCSRPQTVTDGQDYFGTAHLKLSHHKYDQAGLRIFATACANPECKEITLRVEFTSGEMAPSQYGLTYRSKAVLATYPLRPESLARSQPEYIPVPLREDYVEACRIRDLSPKASATLARRCLQGMIRDFCGIKRGRLIDEIKELRLAVDKGAAPRGVTHESVEAIDHVRSVGNIGAHMEADVNLVIDIDPGEAQALIELIEMLFLEWYVERKTREERLAKVAAIGAAKKQKGTAQGPPQPAAQPQAKE